MILSEIQPQVQALDFVVAETEAIPSGKVTLSELIGCYYPQEQYPQKEQILHVIRRVHSLLIDSEIPLTISIDPFIPILKQQPPKDGIENPYLKLNIICGRSTDPNNLATRINFQAALSKYQFEPVELSDIGLPDKHTTDVYRMIRDENKIEGKSPLIITQRHETALGKQFYTLKIALDTQPDSPENESSPRYKTIFEMNFSYEHDRAPLYRDEDISWDRGEIEWVNKPMEEPYAVIPSEVMKVLDEPLEVFDEEKEPADPRDYLVLALKAARAICLATNAGNTVGPIFGKNFSEIDGHLKEIVYELVKRGEDFKDDIDDCIRLLDQAKRNNPQLFESNLQSTGFDTLLTQLKETAEADRPSLPAIERLKIYAGHMRFTPSLAQENLQIGDKMLSCLVLKDNRLMVLRYDSTITDKNPQSHAIIKALEAAASSLGDPTLSGCTIIVPCKPDTVGQIALRMRTGIETVIWSIPNPYVGNGEDQNILSSPLYGPPPQIIEGLLRPEISAFFRDHPVNHGQRASIDYDSALKALSTQENSREREIMVEFLGTDFEDKRVLDAGCGVGGETAFFTNPGAQQVYGRDISPYAIQLAKTSYPEMADQFTVGPIENLPYPDNWFDIILCKYALNEISKEKFPSIYNEFHRCLKNGGKLLLFIHDPVSQMFSADSETGEILLDLHRQSQVNVRLFDNKIVVVEPRHTHADYVSPLLKLFRLKEFTQGQDEQKMHLNRNITEMLVLLAEKE